MAGFCASETVTCQQKSFSMALVCLLFLTKATPTHNGAAAKEKVLR